MTAKNVPDTTPGKPNVPSMSRGRLNVPDTTAPKAAAPAAKSQAIKPDAITRLPRNARPYIGQKLGVKTWDGTVKEIENNIELAIVSWSGTVGLPRVLDRSPWTGFEIVELS
jgi:hypothetical protein